MNKGVYIEATYRALTQGADSDVVVRGLKAVLERNGHTALYKKILEEVARRLEKQESAKVAHITVARAQDAEKYEREITEFIKTHGAHHTKIVIDEHLIGGFVAKTHSHRTDHSYKESLLSIYKSLTAH